MNPYMENTLHLQKRATNIYHTGASKSVRGGADWQPPREAVAGPGLLDPVGNGRKSCSQMTSGSSVFTIFVAEVGVWSMLSHLCSSSGHVPGSPSRKGGSDDGRSLSNESLLPPPEGVRACLWV